MRLIRMYILGERLRSIREEKKVSSKQLERLSGISQSAISKIETNIQSPSVETLMKICNALDITIIDLIENNDLSPDILNLISTAKKLSPYQRKKLTEFIDSIIK
nr:helix-turn-helix transcriptional regulator [Oceanobacillus arenosus]